MDKLLSFLADNYVWFLIGAGVLALALIGFIVDSKKKNNSINSGTTETYASGAEESFFNTPPHAETTINEEKPTFKAEPTTVVETPIEEVQNEPTNNIESVDLFSNSDGIVAPPVAQEEPIDEVTFEPTEETIEEPIISTEQFNTNPGTEPNNQNNGIN